MISEFEDIKYTDAVKQNILDGSSKWFAKISVTGKVKEFIFSLFRF